MSDQVNVEIEPSWLLLQLTFCCSAGVGFASKAPISQMPAFLLPGGLGFAHLSLQGGLSALQGRLGVDDDPSFAALRQLQFPTEPVHRLILRLLPTLAPFLDERFGLGHRP